MYCLNNVRDKLYKEYKLELNRKIRIYNIKEGIEFLGYRYVIKIKSNKEKKVNGVWLTFFFVNTFFNNLCTLFN